MDPQLKVLARAAWLERPAHRIRLASRRVRARRTQKLGLPVLGSLLLALVAITISPARAAAWCQSCSTVIGTINCMQPCYACDGERDVPLSWRRRCIEYNLEQAGSRTIARADVLSTLERSFAEWTSVQCDGEPVGFETRARTDVAECTRPEFNKDGSNANTIVFVDDWSRRGHALGAFALTTTWFSRSTGEILDADMELNEQRWTFEICPTSGCTEADHVDLENTLVHELGHFLGLAHSDADPETTMWACAEPAETLKRDLASDDRVGLCSIYADGRLNASCDFEPAGGFHPACGVDQPSCRCSAPGRGRPFPGVLLLLIGLVYAVRRSKSQ